MADLHLNRADLESLTGLKQPKRMCDWLSARGWPHEPPERRGDIPKVSRAYHDARLSGQKAPDERRERPQLDWMVNPA